MHLITCRHQNRERIGVLHDGKVALLPLTDFPASMLELIAAGPALLSRLRAELPRLTAHAAPDNVELLAPIPRPRKNIMCLGLNYKDHAEESMRAKKLPVELPEYPVVFTKSPTSVTADGATVPAHAGVTHELDWEVELGVVIGAGGRAIRARGRSNTCSAIPSSTTCRRATCNSATSNGSSAKAWTAFARWVRRS